MREAIKLHPFGTSAKRSKAHWRSALASAEWSGAHALKGCIKNCSIVKLYNNNKNSSNWNFFEDFRAHCDITPKYFFPLGFLPIFTQTEQSVHQCQEFDPDVALCFRSKIASKVNLSAIFFHPLLRQQHQLFFQRCRRVIKAGRENDFFASFDTFFYQHTLLNGLSSSRKVQKSRLF